MYATTTQQQLKQQLHLDVENEGTNQGRSVIVLPWTTELGQWQPRLPG